MILYEVKEEDQVNGLSHVHQKIGCKMEVLVVYWLCRDVLDELSNRNWIVYCYTFLFNYCHAQICNRVSCM